MIIVNERGDEVYLFSSIEDAEGYLEVIDIENNEYEVCDDEGIIYKFELVKPLKALSPSKFKIIKTNEKNANLPKQYFINYGRKFSKTDEELESIFNKVSCASEAIKALRGNRASEWGFRGHTM